MENSMTIRISAEIDGLTVRTLRVLKFIEDELGDRTDRVDYALIAGVLNLEWNNVKYAVQSLVKAGILKKSDGKLTVVKRIVV